MSLELVWLNYYYYFISFLTLLHTGWFFAVQYHWQRSVLFKSNVSRAAELTLHLCNNLSDGTELIFQAWNLPARRPLLFWRILETSTERSWSYICSQDCQTFSYATTICRSSSVLRRPLMLADSDSPSISRVWVSESSTGGVEWLLFSP